MNSIFNRKTITQLRERYSKCTEAEALAKLEQAANRLVKEARWSGYKSKINELRIPLLQLRMARRKP
jgi:hypothetical protein